MNLELPNWVCQLQLRFDLQVLDPLEQRVHPPKPPQWPRQLQQPL